MFWKRKEKRFASRIGCDQFREVKKEIIENSLEPRVIRWLNFVDRNVSRMHHAIFQKDDEISMIFFSCGTGNPQKKMLNESADCEMLYFRLISRKRLKKWKNIIKMYFWKLSNVLLIDFYIRMMNFHTGCLSVRACIRWFKKLPTFFFGAISVF